MLSPMSSIKSLTRFALPVALAIGLSACATPFKADVSRFAVPLHRVPDDLLTIDLATLVPELAKYPKMRGWRKQQIVKLAIAAKMQAKFYLTFDADAICLKPISAEKLIVDGKALLQYEQRAQHPKWWKASARILKMNANVGDPQLGMTVTPAILATDIVKGLMQQRVSAMQAQLPAQHSTRLQVLQLIEQSLLSGELSAEGVARHLGISRQTLHRHLREEDCCFSELLTQVRRQRALQRLQQPDCRIEALSRELGFSEPSAFYKAFKGWFGLSPKAYQQQVAGDSTDLTKPDRPGILAHL